MVTYLFLIRTHKLSLHIAFGLEWNRISQSVLKVGVPDGGGCLLKSHLSAGICCEGSVSVSILQ